MTFTEEHKASLLARLENLAAETDQDIDVLIEEFIAFVHGDDEQEMDAPANDAAA